MWWERVISPNAAFKRLAERGNFGPREAPSALAQHFMWLMEWTFSTHLGDADEIGRLPSETGELVKVIDVRGLGWADFGGDTATFFKHMANAGHHFPERVGACVILHAPTFFAMVWSSIKYLLSKRTRSRTHVSTGNGLEILRRDCQSCPAISLCHRYGPYRRAST